MEGSQNMDSISSDGLPPQDEVQIMSGEAAVDQLQEKPSSSSQVSSNDSLEKTTKFTQSDESGSKDDMLPDSSGTTDETGAAGNSSFLDCPICLQPCIHPARLPCGHIFCFLCIKGVAYKNQRCAMCRREIPLEFLERPQLVNGMEDICKSKCTDDGYQWFYEGRNGGWWAYDKRSSDEIEEVYCEYLNADVVNLTRSGAHHDMLITGTIYSIDFVDMVQYPKNTPMRRRWWQYDTRTSQDIEEAYKNNEKTCTILVAGYVYIVDLETMVQQRQNEPTRCRRIKRDLGTVPKKGVAGLRIDSGVKTADLESSTTTNLESVQLLENSGLANANLSVSLALPCTPSTSRQPQDPQVQISLAPELGRISAETPNRLPHNQYITSSSTAPTFANASRQRNTNLDAELSAESTATAAGIETSEPQFRPQINTIENILNEFQQMSIQSSASPNEEVDEIQQATWSRKNRDRF